VDTLSCEGFGHRGLEERILAKLRASNTLGRIKRVLEDSFSAALTGEAVYLDRPTRNKLFIKTSGKIIDDVLNKLDPGNE
jgi:hypothetical protein